MYAVLLLTTLGFAACTTNEKPTAPFAPFPVAPGRRANITPADLLTQTGFTPIRISFGGSNQEALLQQVATKVKLRTYPELVAVPFTPVIHAADPGVDTGTYGKDAAVGPAYDYSNWVELTPQKPLDPARWYVMSFDALTTSDGFIDERTLVVPGEPKQYGARFCPGSAPIINRVRVGATGAVEVTFSEGVMVDPKTVEAYLLARNPDSSPCKYRPPSFMPQGPVGAADFDCDASAFKQSNLTVTLTQGLKNPDGAALSWFDGSATTSSALTTNQGARVMKFTADCGSGCLRWTP